MSHGVPTHWRFRCVPGKCGEDDQRFPRKGHFDDRHPGIRDQPGGRHRGEMHGGHGDKAESGPDGDSARAGDTADHRKGGDGGKG